jgi:hypothetical protein
MRTKACYIFAILSMLGCDVLTPSDTFLPEQNDAAILTGVKYISHTPGELIMDADVTILNSFYSGFDNDYLKKEDVAVVGDGTYLIESFNVTSENAASDAACILLLIDQSGSYLQEDPFNSRSQVLSKFAYDVNVHDQLLIGAASDVGTDSPVEFSSDSFDNDSRAHSMFIYSLSTRTGGGSSLATASMISIDRLTTCSNSKKELVIFHHSEWLSEQTQQELVARAKGENVAMHMISLGNDRPDEFLYSGLATETKGFYIGCPSVHEVGKVFSELSRLLTGKRTGYRMRIRFLTSPAKPLLPGSITQHTIQIVDPYSGKNYNPVLVNVTIPS